MIEKSPVELRVSNPGARIVSQAVIIFTQFEDEQGQGIEVRSFGSPEGPDGSCEQLADHLLAVFRGIVENPEIYKRVTS